MASDVIPPNLKDDIVPSPQSQVKLQLTTRHSDLSLPENTGPILVNTSKCYALRTHEISLTQRAPQLYAVTPFPRLSILFFNQKSLYRLNFSFMAFSFEPR